MPDPSKVPADSGEGPQIQRTTYFDRDGELKLEIGPNGVECVVCPRALARASPVFKRMLYGGFGESKPSQGDWVVKLPEDNAEALMLVLHIIHGQYNKVPEILPCQKLYRITVLTDKYDLTSCLTPWAANWVRLVRFTYNEGEQQDYSLWLWSAWELGNEAIFREAAHRLVANATATSFERPTQGDKSVIMRLEKLAVFDLLAQGRTKLLDLLLEPVKQFHDSLLGLGSEKACRGMIDPGSRLTSESAACKATLLASFLKALHDAALYSLDKTSLATWQGSPRDLYKKLVAVASSIQPLQIIEQDHEEYDEQFSNHSECNPKSKLRYQLRKAYGTHVVTLGPTHVAHLRTQAVKTSRPVMG